MVEAFLAAIVGAGLSENDFWSSTPYLTDLRLAAVGKVRRESALLTGWMAERFAREERLQGPQTYIRQFFQSQDQAEVDAPDPIMFHRMAQDWGLEIEPYSE